MTENVIAARAVEFAWETGLPALSNLDVEVQRGEVVGLLGRNGAGKTTLLQLLLGSLRPQAGEVRVFGMDPVVQGVPVKRRLGFVPEEREIPDHLAVAAVLDLHRRLFPTWDAQLERDLLERFDVDPKRRVGALSKGQARQLALICAVSHRPELLLLDEPGGGVDPAMRRELLEAALQLLIEDGSTILFSSHHVHDVERLAERVVVIDKGAVALDAGIDDLKELHCVATVPADPDGRRAMALHEMQDCLRVRKREGDLVCIVRGETRGVEASLSQQLETNVTATHVGVEDLFVELVGRER